MSGQFGEGQPLSLLRLFGRRLARHGRVLIALNIIREAECRVFCGPSIEWVKGEEGLAIARTCGLRLGRAGGINERKGLILSNQ